MLFTLKKVNGLLVKTSLITVDEELIEKARAQQEGYVKSGILSGNYIEDQWILNGQTHRSKINFGRKRKALQRVCEMNGMDYRRIVELLKVYTIMRIDVAMPPVLSGQVGFFIDELIRSEMGTVMEAPKARVDCIRFYIDFLELIPGVSQDYIKLCCEVNVNLNEEIKTKRKDRDHPTRLNEFLSYFALDKELREWWLRNTDMDKKIYFFPLYLFWIITTILPLRVTEFCVTPLNCIVKKEGKFFLAIRRTRLKGSSSAYPTIRYHMISKDYTVHQYEIPRWIYEEIALYKELTKSYDHPYELLFSVDAVLHLNYGTTRTSDHEKAYGPQELGESIKLFYADVLLKERRYSIVSEEELLKRSMTEEGTYQMNEQEIMLIHPKETRHLAMINLILRGANPMTIMEFAGHTNATTSAHYYSNISNLVRCVTKHIYDLSRASGYNANLTNFIRPNSATLLINLNDPYEQVDGGDCYSRNFLAGGTADCQRHEGNCKKCGFFIKAHGAEEGNGGNDEEKDAEIEAGKSIDRQMDFYAKMLRDPNLDDKIEEFQVRTLKLEEAVEDFSTQLWQEFMRKSHEKEKDKT